MQAEPFKTFPFTCKNKRRWNKSLTIVNIIIVLRGQREVWEGQRQKEENKQKRNYYPQISCDTPCLAGCPHLATLTTVLNPCHSPGELAKGSLWGTLLILELESKWFYHNCKIYQPSCAYYQQWQASVTVMWQVNVRCNWVRPAP